jgi:hypothetical protein
MLRNAFICLVLPALVGCTPHYTPPAPAVSRSGTAVSASFGKTWDVVVGIFAERNIRIQTIDRASGLIVAQPQRVGLAPDAADRLADCGTMSNGGAHLYPTDAVWNVYVRGDSSASTIRATINFVWMNPMRTLAAASAAQPCETRGVWEQDFEQRVKATVEARR